MQSCGGQQRENPETMWQTAIKKKKKPDCETWRLHSCSWCNTPALMERPGGSAPVGPKRLSCRPAQTSFHTSAMSCKKHGMQYLIFFFFFNGAGLLELLTPWIISYSWSSARWHHSRCAVTKNRNAEFAPFPLCSKSKCTFVCFFPSLYFLVKTHSDDSWFQLWQTVPLKKTNLPSWRS